MSVAFGFDGFEGIGSVGIILGDVFLRNLHTTYDRENLTATFRQVSLDRWESICFFSNCHISLNRTRVELVSQESRTLLLAFQESFFGFQLPLLSELQSALSC